MSLEKHDEPVPFDDATQDELRFLLKRGVAGRKVYWTATPERRAERDRRILAEYAAGDFGKRIAWRYGCATSTIAAVVKRHGGTLRQGRRPKNERVDAAAREWLEECKKPIGQRLSGRKMAAKHGINHNQLAGRAWRMKCAGK
jgi:transposase